METELVVEKKKYDVADVVRTSILGVILIIFAAIKLPYTIEQTARFKDQSAYCEYLIVDQECEWGLCQEFCDNVDLTLSAFAIITVGLALIIIFSIAAIVQKLAEVDHPECTQKFGVCGMVLMACLVCGGLLYMAGYWIIMSIAVEGIELDGTEIMTIDPNVKNWFLTIYFFEFYLGGMTAIIYGINCGFQIFSDEFKRIGVILCQLCLVSLVLFIGFAYLSARLEEFSDHMAIDWVYLPIASCGYAIIFLACVMYLVVYMAFSRYNKGDKDCDALVKYAIGGLMMIGAFFAALASWAAFMQFNKSAQDAQVRNAWHTSYCLLLFFLCCYNGVDIILSQPFKKKYETVPNQE